MIIGRDINVATMALELGCLATTSLQPWTEGLAFRRRRTVDDASATGVLVLIRSTAATPYVAH